MRTPTLPSLLILAFLTPPVHAEGTKTYIVQFKDSAVQAPVRKPVRDARRDADPQGWGYVDEHVMERTQTAEARYGVKADHAYSHVMKGFAARLTAAQVALLKADPSVMAIEEDKPMYATGHHSVGHRANPRHAFLDPGRQRRRCRKRRECVCDRHRHRHPPRSQSDETHQLSRRRQEYRL